MKYGYDSKCYDLAYHLLFDTPHDTEANRKSLAQDIQNAVEDWFADQEPDDPRVRGILALGNPEHD